MRIRVCWRKQKSLNEGQHLDKECASNWAADDGGIMHKFVRVGLAWVYTGLALALIGVGMLATSGARAQPIPQTQDDQRLERLRQEHTEIDRRERLRQDELAEMERRQARRRLELQIAELEHNRMKLESKNQNPSYADFKRECELKRGDNKGGWKDTDEVCKLADRAKWREQCKKEPAGDKDAKECRLTEILEYRRQIRDLDGPRPSYAQLKDECALKRAGILGPWPDVEVVCKTAEFARKEEENRSNHVDERRIRELREERVRIDRLLEQRRLDRLREERNAEQRKSGQ
jgi:hypothetical protein